MKEKETTSCTTPHTHSHQTNSREREAVLCQTNDLIRLHDKLCILREKMCNDLSFKEEEVHCGECDKVPLSTFDRILVNNHHIHCLTGFVDDLITRFQP